MAENRKPTGRWAIALLVAVAFVLGIAEYVKQLTGAIVTHEATGIVRHKEYVRYDETHHSFVDDDGDRIERRPGDEEWRVYFEIVSLKGFDEHTARRLRDAEEQRVADGKMRYTILFKDEYDKVDPGDLLTVIYQRITNSRLIIDSTIDFRKPQSQ